MSSFKHARIVLLCAGCFGLGSMWGIPRIAPLGAEPNPPVEPVPPLPMATKSNI